jgi:virginiamycin B lyase
MRNYLLLAASVVVAASILISPSSIAAGATSPQWVVFTPGTGLPVYYSIAKTADNDIWVPDNQSGNLYRFSPDGLHVKTFPLYPYHPEMMIVGPGGDLYFNSLASGAIGIVSQAGQIRTYPLPQGVYAFGGLTAGADGNVWFVAESYVGRITPAGVITLFPYIKWALSRVGMASGPDKKIWFVGNTQHGIIGNIDPVTKKFTTYGLWRAQWCYPNSIVSGPDGNLWFSCQRDGIGTITTSGSYKMFRMPGFNFSGSPASIAMGPDGALWFSGGKSGTPGAEIGRFDLHTHRVTTWKAPSYVTPPWSIAFDADGNVWGASLSAQVVVFVPRSL